MNGRPAVLAMLICTAFGVQFAFYWIRHSGDFLVVLAGIAFAGSAAMAYIQLALFYHNRPRRIAAPRLEGRVRYDSTDVSEALVEEFSTDWSKRLSFVKTGSSGFFELPPTVDGPAHHLKITWQHSDCVRLEVHIAPGAPPLVVQLPALSSWNRR
jgi:hypothetical protein